MDDNGIPLISAEMQLMLLEQPPGFYGISYDIYTRKTQDNLPVGWHSHRSKL